MRKKDYSKKRKFGLFKHVCLKKCGLRVQPTLVKYNKFHSF